jgi:hypothetical protein
MLVFMHRLYAAALEGVFLLARRLSEIRTLASKDALTPTPAGYDINDINDERSLAYEFNRNHASVPPRNYMQFFRELCLVVPVDVVRS